MEGRREGCHITRAGVRVDAVAHSEEYRVAQKYREVLSMTAKRILLMATLDVRNAFNSVWSADIVQALPDAFPLPPYLLWVLKDYLRLPKNNGGGSAGLDPWPRYLERGLWRGAGPPHAARGLSCRLLRRPGYRHHDQEYTGGTDETEPGHETGGRMDAKSGTKAGINRVIVPDEETDRHYDTHDGADVRCASWSVCQVPGGDVGHEHDILAAHMWRFWEGGSKVRRSRPLHGEHEGAVTKRT